MWDNFFLNTKFPERKKKDPDRHSHCESCRWKNYALGLFSCKKDKTTDSYSGKEKFGPCMMRLWVNTQTPPSISDNEDEPWRDLPARQRSPNHYRASKDRLRYAKIHFKVLKWPLHTSESLCCPVTAPKHHSHGKKI